MARQRFIHPEFWGDPSIGQLTPIERLFFVGCFSNADDEGRLLGHPAWLRSAIFPYDDISLDEVRAMRDRAAAVCRNFAVYEVDGVEYIAFLKWNRYQKPKYPKPSTLPPPSGDGTSPDWEKRFSNASGSVPPLQRSLSSTEENGGVGHVPLISLPNPTHPYPTLPNPKGDGVAAVDNLAPVDNSEPKKRDETNDPDTRIVVNAYFNVFKRHPSPLILQDLFEWIDKLGGGLVAEALRRTAEASKDSWSYTKAILEKWENSRVASMADVERLDSEHRARGQARAAPVQEEPPPPKLIEIDPAELEAARARFKQAEQEAMKRAATASAAPQDSAPTAAVDGA